MTVTTHRTQLLAEQLQGAIDVFTSVTDGITTEIAHTQPEGSANSIAATLGHLLTSIDGITNGMFRGSAPLFTQMPTGLSEMPPGGADTFNWYDWGTQVQVDLDVVMTYGAAVFTSVADYLNEISDEVLDERVNTPSGEWSKQEMFSIVVLGGLHQHSGEMSALKGIFASLKGFAF